ncbi:ABC transporter permease [Streptomyces sp. TRM66268-LWL]|uniref:ABC transporter permease n=1 Tax=Streptomyces polyasparticus TaxID=2767826 RepID=A0ABR7SLQ8_9ACTN|nr:ABC transporter permease [Streptomyces polyasparticus]MBC9716269.1 ABC transporter permease [Streptomyces polyasparticus]
MSTIQQPERARTAPPAPPGTGAGVRALALTEGRRLLRHPAFLGSLLLCVALWVYESVVAGSSGFPVLHDEDRLVQSQLLLIAAGTFLAVHLAAIRPARDGTEGWFLSLVLLPWQRAAALLLAVLPAALLTAVLAGARIGWLAAQPGAAGSPSPAELAAGPAAVLVAGTLAVLLGLITRSVAAGPIALACLAIVTVVGALFPFESWRWWGLIAVEDELHAALPSGLLHRPAGQHLLYLLLLALACATAALLRAGLKAASVRVLLAVSLAGVAVAGVLNARPAPDSLAAARQRALDAPSEGQTCVKEGELTYCAFPEFLDRHKEWARVSEGILRWVPGDARDPRYTVRQHITPVSESSLGQTTAPIDAWAEDDRKAGTSGAVAVGTAWGDGSDLGRDATGGFATAFAARVVTGEPARSGPQDALLCGGRSVLTLWLAGQAAPGTAEALRSRIDRSFGGLIGFGTVTTVETEQSDIDLAFRLLNLPAADVGAKAKAHWAELTAKDTSSAEAARLLGLDVPEQPDGYGKDSMCSPR